MAQKKNTASSFLDKFYHNPVAVVSFELFLSIGVIIFFALFAIHPTLVTMSDLIKEIEDKEKLDTQMAQKVASLASAQAQYLIIEDRAGLLDEALPTGPKMTYSLKVIEKAASDNSVLISTVSVLEIPAQPDPSKTVSELEVKKVPIQVGVEASYVNIRAFVEQLKASRRSFNIDRITFTTQESRGDKSLKASILLSAPYFGNKEK